MRMKSSWWFKEPCRPFWRPALSLREAKYVMAQTHVTNTKLQALFQKHGYFMKGPIEGKHYKYFELRKSLVKS